MPCNRCPHHVRHGKLAEDKKGIVFSDHCGLILKQQQPEDQHAKKQRGRGRPMAALPQRRVELPKNIESTDCIHFPFDDSFDYFRCEVYLHIFESKGIKNGVLPTKDFHYSDSIASVSVTDMELL
ncbi:MAG: hypothetical protein OXT67_03415 [Zetaproteobacteria bacterium]|nr:hypothetical protein [Zetaproteobacteria bacterium]